MCPERWPKATKKREVAVKSTLIVVALVVCVFVSNVGAASDAWSPSGTGAVGWRTKNINPCTSGVTYDDPQAFVDGWLNLPVGFAFEITEYAGLDSWDLNENKGDEMDLILWYMKKFQSFDLKLRLKTVNYSDIGALDDKDILAEDIFLSKTWTPDEI